MLQIGCVPFKAPYDAANRVCVPFKAPCDGANRVCAAHSQIGPAIGLLLSSVDDSGHPVSQDRWVDGCEESLERIRMVKVARLEVASKCACT